MVLDLHSCVSASSCANGPRASRSVTYQGFVLNLLADELVFTQGIAGLPGDGVDGPLLHLLLDGAVQHKQRLPGTLLRACAHTHTDSHVRALHRRTHKSNRAKTSGFVCFILNEMKINVMELHVQYRRTQIRMPAACAA